jgi:hypothetical protein
MVGNGAMHGFTRSPNVAHGARTSAPLRTLVERLEWAARGDSQGNI